MRTLRWQRMALAVGLSAGLAGAAAASEEYRWFEGRDRVYVRQHEMIEEIHEPAWHLQRAHEAFAHEHITLCADELEKAAAGFAYFRDRRGASDHKTLDRTVKSLDKLADDVRAKRVDGIAALDAVIADANRVIDGQKSAAAAPSPAPAQ
jgi:hypothetical protein